MKQMKLLILMLAFLAGGAPSALAAADTIDWHTYESGMARSRFEKKKVFLYFHAEWCGYCAEMDRKTFKDPAVIAALNRSFIPIRVDSDRETAVASLFRVKGLPFSVFLNDVGDKIAHVPGFIPSDQMLKILTVVMAAHEAK
jgi:thioredoxin-related protein